MSTLKTNAIRNITATSDAITLASDGTATAKITNNLSNRNIIINGEMQISQRDNVTGVTGSSWGGPDRFEFRESADATVTVNQSTESPDGFSKSYHVDITTVDSSIGASQTIGFRYQAEGYDVQRFAKGTSSAKAGVLSFYVKTNKTGTYAVNLYDNTNSRHFSDTYTVSDTNWNRYSIAVPADTTGAWAANANGALEILWLLSAGTDFTSGSSPTAWAAYSGTATTYAGGHNVNFADSTSNDFYITGIQLEVDSTNSGKPSDYENRSYGDDLARCQRYYQLGIADGVVKGTASGSVAGRINFQQTMRAEPSIGKTSGDFKIGDMISWSTTASSPTINNSGYKTWGVSQGFSLSGMSGFSSGGIYRHENNSSQAVFTLSAEL